MPCPLPRRIKRVLVSIASPAHAAFPKWQEGSASALSLSRPAQASLRLWPIRIAQPPKATFVARLQPSQLPNQAARQLPDQSTTIRVEPASTDDSRLRGASAISGSHWVANGWAAAHSVFAKCFLELSRSGDPAEEDFHHQEGRVVVAPRCILADRLARAVREQHAVIVPEKRVPHR